LKNELTDLVAAALEKLRANGDLAVEALPPIVVERSRGGDHGDFACTVALSLAKVARTNPRQLATAIVDNLANSEAVEKFEIAGPGFINFFLAPAAFQALVPEILCRPNEYGRTNSGAGKKVQVEFVSANPTGPLHIGHGRGAAYGDTVASLLSATGHDVQREYYVNDAGRQMDILATSIWLRYLQLEGVALRFPDNGYQGDYIADMARDLRNTHGGALVRDLVSLEGELPPDASQGGDKEKHIDGLIAQAKQLLGSELYGTIYWHAREFQVEDIRADLAAFGVRFDNWYSEASLKQGPIDVAAATLAAAGLTYSKDGAIWFKSAEFGDEKDRVIFRENGEPTYFASDIAYHKEKFERGFEHIIDVWGADHHGYVARVKGALQAVGKDAECFDVLLVQFANLYRGGEKVQMSTRSGQFVTLKELREEVGVDAARFFYVMRRCEQHLDFDLDLAKSRSNDNPVYYIQYAHARICSVLSQAAERGMAFDETTTIATHLLSESHELDLLKTISRYPEVIESSAAAYEPHQLAFYLRELANDLHGYYNAHQFLVDDSALRQARLGLIKATGVVLRTGLGLLGVSAPQSM